MIEPLSTWDIKYFHFALECDVTILEALFIMNPGDREFLLYQAQNQIVDIVKVVENNINYMTILSQTYPRLANHNNKFQLSKYTVLQIDYEDFGKSMMALHFVTKLEESFFLITFLTFTFSNPGFWTLDQGDVNLVIGNMWPAPHFQRINLSEKWLAEAIDEAHMKILSNYDLTSPACRRIRTNLIDFPDIFDFEKTLKISCHMEDMSFFEPSMI